MTKTNMKKELAFAIVFGFQLRCRDVNRNLWNQVTPLFLSLLCSRGTRFGFKGSSGSMYAHLPLPKPNINTYFSLWGGVGGQFPNPTFAEALDKFPSYFRQSNTSARAQGCLATSGIDTTSKGYRHQLVLRTVREIVLHVDNIIKKSSLIASECQGLLNVAEIIPYALE